MDSLERLLQAVLSLAVDNGMDAYIVGVRNYADSEDGRLLKICPRGSRSKVLVEIESNGPAIRLYKHRTEELTSKHGGRPITTEWVKEFIKQNRVLAFQLTEQQATDEPSMDEELHQVPLIGQVPGKAHDEARSLKQKRFTVACSCRGEVEKCIRCFGSGSYTIDGYGNKV